MRTTGTHSRQDTKVSLGAMFQDHIEGAYFTILPPLLLLFVFCIQRESQVSIPARTQTYEGNEPPQSSPDMNE